MTAFDRECNLRPIQIVLGIPLEVKQRQGQSVHPPSICQRVGHYNVLTVCLFRQHWMAENFAPSGQF